MRTETSGRFDWATGGTATLRGPVAQEHEGNGAQENFQVEPQRPVVEVKQVELHPVLEINSVAALERPQAGQAGTHAQAPPLPRFIFLHFLRNGRSRADERHVTTQDIPQLRQLIDAQLAQPAAERRTARVVFHLENRAVELVELLELWPQLIGVVHHRAKFEQRELPAAETTTSLTVEDRAARGQ